MTFTQFTNLNFEDIKASIKDYLRSNSNFTDFDFEGSNLSVIINTLAYNTYLTAFNTNMAVNESFIDTATLRENIVSLARNIGYVPRSKRAAIANINLSIAGISSNTSLVAIQPGIVALGNASDANYVFSIPEEITISASNSTALGNMNIYQGNFITQNFVVDTSQPNQRFVLPNANIDTSTIRVKVKDTQASTTSTSFRLVDNIIGINSTSNTYLIQETTDEKYELLFGDGVFGKKLQNNNYVTVSYIVTNGKESNGVSNFTFSGIINDQDGAAISSFVATPTAVTPASNGDDIESVSSIKTYAPRLYSSQYRAVTASDYEAILPTLYPNIDSVTAYGGEELDPPQYGRVFLAVKPRNGTFLSKSTKDSIVQSLKSYSVAGIVPQLIDIKYLYVELDSYVYYDPNYTGDVDTLKSNINYSLSQYASSNEVNRFGGRFRYSKTIGLIDDVSTSITSNITHVKIRRNMVAAIAQNAAYELCFDNEFYRQKPRHNIKSSGFTIAEFPNDTVYISDSIVPNNISATLTTQGALAASAPVQQGVKTGALFLFKILNGEMVIMINNIGSVNYEKGEILLNTLNIISTAKPNNVIEVEAVPLSNDVVARKELYLQLDIANSNIYMRKDLIASGANVSGTTFESQSSYSNGTIVR